MEEEYDKNGNKITIIKKCRNCKHGNTCVMQSPCAGCHKYNNWEEEK